MNHKNEKRVAHYVPLDSQDVKILRDWKKDYHHCLKQWKLFCDSIGAISFFSDSFQKPTHFNFSKKPNFWKKSIFHNNVNYYEPMTENTAILEQIAQLPEPENFDYLCETHLNLPLSFTNSSGNVIKLLANDSLTYYPIWTPLSEIIIKGPSFEFYKENYGQDVPEIDSARFDIVSKNRVNYWFARDKLIVSGEQPD